MNLGGRLRVARYVRDMKQEELAGAASTEDLPISQAMISALEKRDSETTTALFALAKALKVSPEWLQTGKGESGLPAKKLAEVLAELDRTPLHDSRTAGHSDSRTKKRIG